MTRALLRPPAAPRSRILVGAMFGAMFAAALAGCVSGSRQGDAGADGGRKDGSTALAAPENAMPPPPVRAGADAAPPTREAQLERGKLLYGRYCDFCHGKEGQGYAADEAPQLKNPVLHGLATDAFLQQAIALGRPGTTMSGWSHLKGGPLSDADVTALVTFVRTLPPPGSFTAPEPEVPMPVRPVAMDAGDAATNGGDKVRGAKLYDANCKSCHGAEGRGGKYIYVGGDAFLASASDTFLARSIEKGRPGTPMLPFADKLGPSGVRDVVAALRSWQKPVEELGEMPPRPGSLRNIVINPKGPEPSFDPKADFVPVDTVKKEQAAGARMIILDARAPSDYVRAHVAGALSVPFYEVDAYAKELPKDRYILTYCACPHAVSVKLRDALRKLGFSRVAVLDEGIVAWRDRGYGVRGGPKP